MSFWVRLIYKVNTADNSSCNKLNIKKSNKSNIAILIFCFSAIESIKHLTKNNLIIYTELCNKE